jgi:hypothetical protein
MTRPGVRTLLITLILAVTVFGVPGISQPEYVVIDDMLLYPEQLAALEGDATVRPQAHIIDYRNRLGAWDWGVLPYQISEEFSGPERQRILNAFDTWSQVAPIVFVERTTQNAYLNVTRDAATATQPSACFSNVGQARRGLIVRTNIGPGCQSDHTVAHELGHALGLWHEHQRSDRDNYLSIDFENVQGNAIGNFNIISGIPLVGEYDFESIMHYRRTAFAADVSRPTIIPHPPYQQFAFFMGTFAAPTGLDHAAVAFLYNTQLRESTLRVPTEPVRNRFDRTDLLLAMERLHAFYMSRYGLQRPQGLSINGRPDFVGIAVWIFDIYLGARSAGFSQEAAFDIVVANITRSGEWRDKNAGRAPLTPASFTPTISFSRDEFLEVLDRLDRFYSAAEGLQRPDGLSISGGPDFTGIAVWIFDVYLNQRLSGGSPEAAWVVTQNAIRETDEWRRKH